MSNTEMVIDNISVSLMNYQRVVVLKEKVGERYLPVWIGVYEADAIGVKLNGVNVPRPLIHDLVCAIINTLRINAKFVIVDKLEKDTFHSKVVVVANDKEIKFDCRPADAFAVAIRLGIPIFADEEVLRKNCLHLNPKTGKSTRFDSFSESAQAILNSAEGEAKRLNHGFISTGHLLLALVKEGDIVREIMKNMGIDLVQLPVDIETTIANQSNIEEDESGLTSAVKKALQLSIDEAKRLGSERVKPEHLLIGLERQQDGIAAKLLTNLMVNPEKIYIELIRLYTQGYVMTSPWLDR